VEFCTPKEAGEKRDKLCGDDNIRTVVTEKTRRRQRNRLSNLHIALIVRSTAALSEQFDLYEICPD
jgi:hypothetical protein